MTFWPVPRHALHSMSDYSPQKFKYNLNIPTELKCSIVQNQVEYELMFLANVKNRDGEEMEAFQNIDTLIDMQARESIQFKQVSVDEKVRIPDDGVLVVGSEYEGNLKTFFLDPLSELAEALTLNKHLNLNPVRTKSYYFANFGLNCIEFPDYP